MKSLRQYFLTNYPILWNTRAYIVVPLVLVLNLLFLFLGYTTDYKALHFSSYYRIAEPDAGLITFSILLSLAILIIWLAVYFRNNGLKSIYPVKRAQLFLEYLIVFVISLGICSFIQMYRIGALAKFRIQFQTASLISEKNKLNLGAAFLPFNLNDFHISNNCNKSGQYDANTGIIPSDTQANTDASISYKNYCQRISNNYNSAVKNGILTPREINIIANRWLRNNQQDSVRHAILDLLAVCKKYNVRYSFDVNRHVASIFATPDFTVKHVLASYNNGDGKEFIEIYAVSGIVDNLNYTLTREFKNDFWIVFLYMGLGLSILIYSFRLTSVRSWFFGLIGTFIWGILFILIGIGSRDGLSVLNFYIFLCIAFAVFSTLSITSAYNKRFSGISLVWFMWTLPSVFPSVLGRIVATQERYVYDSATYVRKKTYLYELIENHWLEIGYLNVAFVMLVVFLVLIPLARKWQANPVE